MAAFVGSAAGAAVGAKAFTRPAAPATCALPTRRSAAPAAAPPTMGVVDDYMAASVMRQYKAAAVPGGVYTPQCTEGAAAGDAEAKRVYATTQAFRARQSTARAAAAARFETRRRGIMAAHGCAHEEDRVVAFPSMAASMVIGQAEALRACSRYQVPASPAERYMAAAVERRYAAVQCPTGEFTVCTDGAAKGEAEAARVAGGSTAYRARTLPTGTQAQGRFNARAYATAQYGHGCGYEEALFAAYPAVAGAMRPSTGAYAAAAAPVGSSGGAVVVKPATLAVRLAGPNRGAIWPSFLRRPAVARPRAPWAPAPTKSYAPMSEAAVAAGVKAQTGAFKSTVTAGESSWRSGWQPSPAKSKRYI
eukprot:TRINITY_DN629_c0_g1_i9.p2 TRINITY_DN629_c0_g1~~TRINITY_DN629_c0_g1_i9.p2  ORF type:complete len:406 (-),score=127.19 TRINITY_DN629_c0_g1_i9:161-1249(-)